MKHVNTSWTVYMQRKCNKNIVNNGEIANQESLSSLASMFATLICCRNVYIWEKGVKLLFIVILQDY